MKPDQKKVELLAPAGTPEKLEIAIHYGADAVYLAGKDFSLRNFSANFSNDDLQAARRLTRENNVRMYVAVNIYSRDSEEKALAGYLDFLGTVKPDALIVADPAIFVQARQRLPHTPLHLSTQANTTNSGTARFWKNQGAVRINAARELSLGEIRQMVVQGGVEVEAFVHGAMCMAYSGRCLLSGYLTQRDSNRGMCSQPCRFHYTVMEQTRPNRYFPIAEDEKGAYIFNSRDLCMIEHLPELIETGICSFKIEGRMKSVHYLAGAVKVYREAIDAWYADPATYRVEPRWKEELATISHRGYCTGFYFGDPDQTAANVDNLVHPGYRFIAQVKERTPDGGARVLVKNKILSGETVNLLSAGRPNCDDTIQRIVDEYGMTQPLAQPGSVVTLYLDQQPRRLDLIRRLEENAAKGTT